MPASQTSFRSFSLLATGGLRVPQTSFFIRVKTLAMPHEFGILSSLAIFPYQPAKPPAVVHAKTL